MNTQEICKALGNYGCYYLSLLHAVGQDNLALSLFNEALANSYIDKECYLYSPEKILKLATGFSYSVRKENLDYIPQADELTIVRYERVTPGATYTHFVVANGLGEVIYDPLGNSNTVAFGKPVSKRIIKKL